MRSYTAHIPEGHIGFLSDKGAQVIWDRNQDGSGLQIVWLRRDGEFVDWTFTSAKPEVTEVFAPDTPGHDLLGAFIVSWEMGIPNSTLIERTLELCSTTTSSS